MTDITTDLPRLALLAAAAMVSDGLVHIEHGADWKRPRGWPLRRQLGHGTARGSVLCSYRPLDVLRYVSDEIGRPARQTPSGDSTMTAPHDDQPSVKEHPIIFSAPMVRAILAGTKTQTRLEAKDLIGFTATGQPVKVSADGFPCEYICPHGRVGDRLWVREAFRFPESLDDLSPRAVGERAIAAGYGSAWCPTQYEADGTRQHVQEWRDFVTPPMPNEPGRIRNARHMPRWASRITLEITGIRVERLHDISEADAIAEGCDASKSEAAAEIGWYEKPQSAYRRVWESLHGAGSWDPNPWVWAVEFRRVEGAAA